MAFPAITSGGSASASPARRPVVAARHRRLRRRAASLGPRQRGAPADDAGRAHRGHLRYRCGRGRRARRRGHLVLRRHDAVGGSRHRRADRRPASGPCGSLRAGQHVGAALRFVELDGRTALVGSGGDTIRVWDAATGAAFGTPIPDDFQGSNGLPVATVGARVVAIAEDEAAYLDGVRRFTVHDLATGTRTVEVSVDLTDTTGTTYPATVGEVGGRGMLLVADGRDVVMFDFASGARVGAPLSVHEDRVYGMTVVSSPGGAVLVTAAEDRSLRVWDLAGRGGG